MGADDFLSKPIDRVELVLRVRTFLRLRWHEQLLQKQIVALSQTAQRQGRQGAV